MRTSVAEKKKENIECLTSIGELPCEIVYHDRELECFFFKLSNSSVEKQVYKIIMLRAFSANRMKVLSCTYSASQYFTLGQHYNDSVNDQ